MSPEEGSRRGQVQAVCTTSSWGEGLSAGAVSPSRSPEAPLGPDAVPCPAGPCSVGRTNLAHPIARGAGARVWFAFSRPPIARSAP